jgi:hypothetical protein
MTVEGSVAIAAAILASSVALLGSALTWRGEGCCAAPPLPGEPTDGDDDCCTNASHRSPAELYYLNVMAGPRREWIFQDDPDHAWLRV